MSNYRLLWLLAAAAFPALTASAALTHRYSFNDGSAADSAGTVGGKLVGKGAGVTAGKLWLTNDASATSEACAHLQFAGSLLPTNGSVSLAVWFTVRNAGDFARIFDFGVTEGSDGMRFIYFSPRTSEGTARAAITASDLTTKTAVDFDPLDDGKPHMVVMVVDGGEKKLRVYADGHGVGTVESLGENTVDKVTPVNNWLGRSSFPDNPALNGSIDEFRVYDHALTGPEVAALFKSGPDVLPAATPPAADSHPNVK